MTYIDPVAEALEATGLRLGAVCGTNGPLSEEGKAELARLLYEIADKDSDARSTVGEQPPSPPTASYPSAAVEQKPRRRRLPWNRKQANRTEGS